jgi:hypothetical protein
MDVGSEACFSSLLPVVMAVRAERARFWRSLFGFHSVKRLTVSIEMKKSATDSEPIRFPDKPLRSV